MIHANRSEYISSQFLLLCVCVIFFDSVSATPSTSCHYVWQDKANSRKSESGLSFSMLGWAQRPPPRPHTQVNITVSALRLTTPFGAGLLGKDSKPTCGKNYTERDLVACAWNGGLNSTSNHEYVGWLSDYDQRNCGAALSVQVKRSTNPGPVVTVILLDGCPMEIPSANVTESCQELYLTAGVFEALGVSDEEAEPNGVNLMWDFHNPPA
ncbi:hypothetical protein CROQUDRAFT_88710 [Cronartium quercuum f. sp. fusiforme G11]|uniref:Uncharacterized protein n=1 Tax=Cronartium quercuum f. sp. fusiforme G11 TaxID=708437 RepID=A0A9P6NPW9_9BASI|nr:hypothetical protein CROQUDRAFT_88710 [Cronartium quercuum f. sp. fusiforme G11]